MKISEITQDLILSQLRENAEALSETEKLSIEAMEDAAKAFIMGWTGINGVDKSDENGRMLDDYEDLVYPFMTLITEMYDNRKMTVERDKINPTVAQMLNLHTFNYVPQEE